MLKTYQSRFAGEYSGLRYKNKIYQTTDMDQQVKIENSIFFTRGEIKLINTLEDTPEIKPVEDVSLESLHIGTLRKKASDMGIKTTNKTKKTELIQMIEQVS